MRDRYEIKGILNEKKYILRTTTITKKITFGTGCKTVENEINFYSFLPCPPSVFAYSVDFLVILFGYVKYYFDPTLRFCVDENFVLLNQREEPSFCLFVLCFLDIVLVVPGRRILFFHVKIFFILFVALSLFYKLSEFIYSSYYRSLFNTSTHTCHPERKLVHTNMKIFDHRIHCHKQIHAHKICKFTLIFICWNFHLI